MISTEVVIIMYSFCLSRVASGQDAPQALHSFSSETGFHHSGEASRPFYLNRRRKFYPTL
jgi:hypothetical protein